jgi:hypothetical protein
MTVAKFYFEMQDTSDKAIQNIGTAYNLFIPLVNTVFRHTVHSAA